MRTFVAMLCAVLLGTGSLAAQASLLLGDDVSATFEPDVITLNGVVGSGAETGIGSFSLDFNAGANDDVFEWSASSAGNLANTTGLSLNSLAFTDGSPLIDFRVFSTALPDLEFTLTADSIAFTFGPTFSVGPGVVLAGQFITPTTTVPAPAALSMLLLGLLLGRLPPRKAPPA